MDIQQRLAVFFRRLVEAPPAANAEEALRLVCRLIEDVEDEFCPLPPENPPPTAAKGRMYAPQSDMIIRHSDGAIQAQTRRHWIYCARDGRIAIVHKLTIETVVKKQGKS